MKYVFVIILISSFSFSQTWKFETVKDEFGDPTNKKTYKIKINGTFNNTAQSGSRAILYLEYSPEYENFLESIGRLSFSLYEYSNNPADLYRAFQSIELALKTQNNKVLRSVILSNEYASDNEFTLFKYLSPEDKIKERTKKNYINSYTYELEKPTYDVDNSIISEVIEKKNNRVKLNIYSNDSEYLFTINSLGLGITKEQDSILSLRQKKVESEKKVLQKKAFKELQIKQLIINIKTDAELKGLDYKSASKLESFLRKITHEDLENINEIKFGLSKLSYDLRVQEALLKDNNYISLEFIDKDGSEINFSKYDKFENNAFFEYKSLKRLSISKYSNYKTSYFNNIESLKKEFKEKVGIILKDDYGGSVLKEKILYDLNPLVREEGIEEIKNIKIKFSELEFNYWIILNNNQINGSMDEFYFKRNRIKIKKLIKHNNLILNKEYVF
jgi:hypothetical protein